MAEERSLFGVLIGILDDLGDYDFQRFKLFLMDRTLLREFEVIKRNKLETEEKTEILKAMMDSYGIFTFSVMKRVLQALDLHGTLHELSQYAFSPEAIVEECQNLHKHKLKSMFKFMVESLSRSGSKKLLNDVFSELPITVADTVQVEEHEVSQIEKHSRKSLQETTVEYLNILRGRTETGDSIRTVLMKGVAGVGKTVLTQKFCLDWSEDKANQDIDLLFPFTFRALNMLGASEYTLVGLVHRFFSHTKGLSSFQCLKVLFIFDGLDECRLSLDFSRTRVLTDPTESASVEELLVNLFRGNLLPFAYLWITTRPAAANQIPAEYVSIVTEVRGFTDPQKDQYFMKRFKEEATTVISHIKSIRSLYIMCHLPVFCWILSGVLKMIFEQSEKPELPKSLTEMYIHFLVFQAKVKNIKYHGRSGADLHWTPDTKEMVYSLGKLAFEQLLKGKLIFYETDLRESGLDAAEIACYSGVFTEVFREEPGLYEDKVYCFIHLSVQEFFAALHVHQTFANTGINLLVADMPKASWLHHHFIYCSHEEFYQIAVDRALQSLTGNLDLFLRLLLGLSLPTNQSLLHGLLTNTKDTSQISLEIADYIKQKLSEEVSTERSINLLHCLNELNDGSLVQQVQQFLRSGRLSKHGLSPAQWSALAFILLSSEKDLDRFELKNFFASEDALQRLLPVVKASNKALLSGCNLSESSCEALSSVLSSSSLTVLDLSNNDMKDSGLKMLSVGLKSTRCKLQQLRLSGCLITEVGCAALASALRSNPSHLTHLDLSYNHPGATGVNQLCAVQEDPHCALNTLILEPTGTEWLKPGFRKYLWRIALDPNTAHRNLVLSNINRTVTRLEVRQPYPDHQDRFEYCGQILGHTGLTGRCYWEVCWKGRVTVSVSYRAIKRKGRGDDCVFGHNDLSWSLTCHGGGFYIYHDGQHTALPQPGSSSGTVGVFVDCDENSLSFYDVSSNQPIHLYSFSTTFTEPLLPGFTLCYDNSSVTLLN